MQPEHLDLHDSYGHHYVTLNLPAVEPPGECLPNSEIFRRLARALGLDHPRLHESDEEMVRDVLDCDAARAAGITFERLRDEGALRVTVPGVARFADGGFPTAERPPAAARARARREGRRSARRLRAAARARGRRARRGATRSRCSPPPRATSSTRRSPRCPGTAAASARRACTCTRTTPATAASRAARSVRVHNDRGVFTRRGRRSTTPRSPGVAFTYKQQWPKLLGPGEHVNVTIPERDADLGGSPTFHDNRVEVELDLT